MHLEFICRRCGQIVISTGHVTPAEEAVLRAHLETEHREIPRPKTMSLGELLAHFEVRGEGVSRYRRR